MTFQKVEYTFPDEKQEANTNIDIEKSSALEVDISGDKNGAKNIEEEVSQSSYPC